MTNTTLTDNGTQTVSNKDMSSPTNTGFPKTSTGSTAPATTPTTVGDIYVDTTAGTAYVATGTSSSGDWQEIGAGGGGGWELIDEYVGDNTASTTGSISIASTYSQLKIEIAAYTDGNSQIGMQINGITTSSLYVRQSQQNGSVNTT